MKQPLGLKIRELVLVKWLDSKGLVNEWEFLEDIDPLLPSTCLSIGFLLEETKEYTTIVQSISESQVLGRMTIPARSILKVTRLKQ